MAQPMTKEISVKIREKTGLTLTKFAAANKIDYASLKAYISGNCTGQAKNSKANRVRNKLLELEIITQKEVDAINEKSKKSQKIIQKDKADRKKIIARLRRMKQQSVQEYIESNEDYFQEHKINVNLFRSFLAGIGTGMRKNTKSYMIRKLLEKDELLEPLMDEKKCK